MENKQEINTAYTFHSSDVVLYDKNESKINTDNLTFGTKDFTIDIPVYMQKELDLTYDIRYAPANFDISSLNLDLSVDKISIASPNTELEKIDKWISVLYRFMILTGILTKRLQLKYLKIIRTFQTVSMVTAKLNQDGLAKKTVTVDEISVLNAPSDYNCTVNTYGLTFDIIGPEEDISEITNQEILVTVDLLKYTVQSSTFTADATISFPDYDKVWAVGLQKVSITASPVTKSSAE